MKIISRSGAFVIKAVYGLRTVLCSSLMTYLILLPYASAAPTGGQIVGGTGNISQSGVRTTINQNSASMAIDWSTFNVNANERVDFVQPNVRAIALNRILDSNASQIRGMINANGQVVLVNPNGIFFSQGAVVNVGGLIASGLDIDPVDFMNGEYVFSEIAGADGQVVNSGTINASLGGSVTLLGKQVKNEGLIAANLGAVNMAAGKEAVVTFDNGGLMGVKVSREILQDELGVDPAVLNTGEINAEGGRILMSGSVSRDIFSQAVNTGDMEQATSVVMHEDGTFTLGGGADVVNAGTLNVSADGSQAAGQIVVLGENVTNSGEILADAANANGGAIELHAVDTTQVVNEGIISAHAGSEGRGGDIKILGDKVGLFDQAVVDASGADGGGEILVGGDQEGLNNLVRNAEFIYLAENTQVSADALDNGDGGRVITFASDTARILGSLSATGGSNGGDGGFIETSGLRGLQITATPDITAPLGLAGQWLIDPHNITIVSGNGNVGINNSSPFESTADDAMLGVDLITGALMGNGATVIVRTGDAGSENGDITLDTDLNFNTTGTSTLTFDADNDIILNNRIFDSSSSDANNGDRLSLILMAGGDITIGADISTRGGSFTADGQSFASTAEINTTPGRNLPGGAINITASTGNLTVDDLTTVGGNAEPIPAIPEGRIGQAGGAITLTANNAVVANDIIVNGDILATGSDGDDGSNDAPGFDGGRGGDVQINATGSVTVGLINTNGGDGNANDSDADDIGNGGDAGSIDITAGAAGLITLGGNLLAQGGARDNNGFGEDGSGNSITINGAVSLAAGLTIDTTGDGTPEMAGDGTVLFQSTVNGAQSLTINSREDVTFNGAVGGVTPLDELIITLADDFTLNAAINAANDITVTGSAVANTFTIGTGANITSSGGTVTINGGDGNDIYQISANVNGTLNGGDNSDTFNINASGITTTINGGGSASPTDTITVNHLANTDWVVSGVTADEGASGTLTSSLISISFSRIETLTGGDGQDAFSFSGATAAIDTINGGGGNNTLTGRNVSNQWNITANDQGSLGATGVGTPYVVDFSNIQNLQGGSDDDTFVFADGTSISGSVSAGAQSTVDTVDLSDFATVDLTVGGAFNGVTGAERIIGNNTASTLRGQLAVNTWAIQDFDAGGTVADGINDGTIAGIQFAGFNNLVGGANNDSFVFSGTNAAITGSIDGGLQITSDTADFSAVTGTVNVALAGSSNAILGVELITGNDTDSTLQAGDVANTWVLQDFDGVGTVADGTNDGTVGGILFVDFNNLVGGSNNDDFTFIAGSSLTGNINGAGQSTADTVNLSLLVLADITLGTGDGAVQNIEMITGNDAVTSTLRGADTATGWTIGGVGDGVNDGTVDGTEFINFHNLIGGSNDDSFQFIAGASITGSIDGGAEATADTVDFSSLAIVDITLGSAFNGVLNAERILGNGTNSTLRGPDAATTWMIEDFDNAGTAADGTDDGIVGGIQFVNFNNLVGGSDDDNFIFTNSGSISGSVDAGGQMNSDTVDLSALAIVDITLGGNLNGVQNAERIIGNNANSTLRGGNMANNWSIEDFDAGAVADGTNDGVLGGIEFVNFNNLVGGTNDDSFVFALGSSITGSVDGGDQVSADTVDLSALATVDITIGGAANGVVNAERVIGNNTASTLRGADVANTWMIEDFDLPAGLVADGVNDGTVAGIEFVNFNNLVGGSNDDNFVFAAIGSIGGTIDAGGEANVDTVDLSALGIVDVTLNGTMINGVQNAERVIGNSTASTFRGGNVANTWTVGDFDNAGAVADGVNDGSVGGIQFVDFNNIVGGNNVDTFNVTGSLAGTIDAGAQDDVLNVTLSGVESGSVTFIGGADSDSVNLLGGVAGYSGNYNTAVGLNDQFSYTNAAATFTVDYREAETVQDDLIADTLTVNGTAFNDTILLGSNDFTVNGSTTVSYSNKTNLNILGGVATDTVDITMDINLTGSLSVNAESLFLSNVAGSTITADTLELDSIDLISISSAAGTIQTVINNIELNDVAAAVSIDETDAINISRFNNVSAAFDLVNQAGDINSSTALSSSSDFSLTATSGNIDLSNSNQLSGTVSLQAAGNTVTLRNIVDTVLGAVDSQTLAITATGSITGTGNINASGNATLSSTGDISLSGTNDIAAVRVTAADSVILDTSNALSVSTVDSSGDVDISSASGGLTVAGVIDSGAAVSLDAGTGDVALDNTVNANGSISLTGAQIAQAADLDAGGTIQLSSSQGITMSGGVNSTSANGDIRYNATDDINITLLSASNGTAAATSTNGEINDVNGSADNLVASRVELMADSGIGSSDSIETQTSTLFAVNGSGDVQIGNSGLITLEALQNSGDITFVNNDTINIMSGSVDAGFNVGALVMRTTDGDFLGVGSPDVTNPDITARDGTFVGTGNFGTAVRPLVLNIRDSVLISTRVSFDPIFSPNQPNDVRNNSDLQFSGLDTLSAIAGEQLVEVETLGEIDPAIFTSIRNYALDEIAIRLPRDQLYEDEYDE